jgi:hypothetical protein
MKKPVLTLAAVALSSMAISLASCASKSQQAQVASAKGFETVATPATELEDMKRDMENKFIPCGIGVGESADEMVARNVSADESRADLAKTMGTLVQRLSEQYAQNVGSEAKKIWEEGVRQLTDQEISGATVYKTITQYNSENNRYKIYSIMVLNPDLFKNALALASSKQEEFELRVKKDDMMKKLDDGIANYEAKYKK